MNYDGISKNATSVGFHEDGKWMFTGGEDCSARIWDLRSRNLQCQRVFQVKAPVNCVSLHPNQVPSSTYSFKHYEIGSKVLRVCEVKNLLVVLNRGLWYL